MTVDPVSLAINAALLAASMAMTASQEFDGPRLDSLSLTTADYGAPINYGYGTTRYDGVSCIWAEPLREEKRESKTKGGKYNDYRYFGTWAVAVCDHEVEAVTRVWFDRNLVFDATGSGPVTPFAELADIASYMTFYLGTTTQDVDPRMAASVDAIHGAGSTPAYRGVCYIVFKDLPVEKLGNRLPQVSVEVITAGDDTFPAEERTAAWSPAMNNAWGLTYSPDRTRLYFGVYDQFEIWDVRARALMVSGVFDPSQGDYWTHQSVWGITDDGSIYRVGGDFFIDTRLLKFAPDGLGAPQPIGEPVYLLGHCVALKDANGVEHICVTSYSFIDGGYKHVHGSAEGLQILDPVSATGFNWQLKYYFADAYGDIWAAGGNGDLAANVLALWRIVNASGNGGPDFGLVTMPTNQSSSIASVSAFHHLSDTADHFVVVWSQSTTSIVIVDRLTMTAGISSIETVDPYNTPRQFQATRPGAASFWLNREERSAVDLTVLRTLDFEDWGYLIPGSGPMIYDEINHAMIVALSGGEMAWLYLDRVAGTGVTLRSIVEDISERAGLTVADDIDAADLTQTVQGYSWTQGTGKAILEPLLEAYDAEARPHDFKVEFLRRGAAVLGAIPVADMGAGGGERYSLETALDSDLPRKVSLTFADITKDQQPNTAIGQRAGAATDSRRELSLDATTLTLGADEARQMADGYLRRAWMKAQTANLALTRAWSKLEPGDAYTLALDDVSRAFKLTRLEFGANGVLACDWERYAPSVHAATALPGAPADGLDESVVVVFGYTKGLFLDIPLVRDADDALIGYLAAAPYSPDVAWPGAEFYRSDDGTAYDTSLGAVASTQAATMGYAMSALPDALATCWDTASTVTVTLFDGELTSASKADVAGGSNRALLGDEILGFTTATLVAANTYQLSGLHRGRRGTDWATGGHASGERFVLLDALPQSPMGASDVGDSFYARPTTNGGSNGFPQSVAPFTGASLKPYAPAHLAVEDVAGDLVATWTRRTRIGGAWRDLQDVPLGEGSESYVVQVLDAGGALVRNLGPVSSPTATYTAADIATDAGAGETLRVMQVSATVGNGFAADVAI